MRIVWQKIALPLFFQAWFLVALTTVANAAEVATDSKPLIAPPASWVKPHFFDRQATRLATDPSADQHWLLIEHQVNAATNESFHHYIRQIMSVSGVQNGSTLKMDYNPSYQSLTLHWARLWRGTNHLEQLAPDKIRVVRQERDLDDDLLNGEQTAVLVMDAVRVGDIVDYAYSTQGENPVFNGRFYGAVMLQFDEPVERLFNRVLWPASRRIYSKPHNCTALPVITRNQDLVECVWDARQVPGFREEDAVPLWCDPEPWVQLSGFRTWAEVNQWALALFQNSSQLSPALAQKIAGWRALPGREQQVVSVLRFVQDQIRYFGVEIGVNSEKPTDPATVFSRRFGDCKDKSLLFVTLLRSLGIEAYPVLVNTQLRRRIADWQPTAGCFDHCIAVVRLDGQTYWLDPTAGFQRGSLAMHYLPDYGRGLVIAPGNTALSVIPQTTGLPLTTTTEYFSLAGKTGSSSLKVVTVAEGRDADELRAVFANTKRSDIEKNDTHFYSNLYPGIRMTSPVLFEDDEAQNRVQTTEFYAIDSAWTRSDKDGKYRCEFYPYAIAALIKTPVDTRRELPLGVNYPEHQVFRTEVTLPEAWPSDRENKNIFDPAFSFRKESRCTGKTLVVQYEYWALADSVPAERSYDYIQRLGEVSKSLGNSLVWLKK